MKRLLNIALCLALLAGGAQAWAGEGQPGEAHGLVHHVVIVWLKEPGSQAARERYLAISRGMAKLPGVLSYHVGTSIPGTRAVVDSSYDVAVVAVFKDKQALDEYNAGPLHQQAIDELRPLVQKVVVYDFAD